MQTVVIKATAAVFIFAILFSSIAQGQRSQDGVSFEMINLYDAFGKVRPGTVQDFGFSTLIRYRGKTILFDAGTDAKNLERNVKALGVDLSEVDIAIVSHSHYDHIGGFDYLLDRNPKVRIYLPHDFSGLGAPTTFPFRDAEPSALEKLSKDEIYFRGEKSTDGMRTVPTGRFWRSNIEYVRESKEIMPGVTIVPTTSKLMGTFIRYPPFETEPMLAGMPELTASFATAEGNVIISGCSHSGIENIVSAVNMAVKTKPRLVTGGFHLIPYDRKHIETLADKLKSTLDVHSVAPAHCTGHLGFSIFKERFGDDYRFFGLGEKIVLTDSKGAE